MQEVVEKRIAKRFTDRIASYKREIRDLRKANERLQDATAPPALRKLERAATALNKALTTERAALKKERKQVGLAAKRVLRSLAAVEKLKNAKLGNLLCDENTTESWGMSYVREDQQALRAIQKKYGRKPVKKKPAKKAAKKSG
jgi:hypothetical protein